MKRIIIRTLLIALLLGVWLSNSGCSLDGESIVIVNNVGTASIVIYFIDITTKLDAGESETYVVTLPGKDSQQQILSWYPIIHPNKHYYETVTLEDGKGRTINLSYDPQNPPARD